MSDCQLSNGAKVKRSGLALLAAGIAFAAGGSMAAPAAFPTTTTTVKVDDVPIGEQIAAGDSLRNTVVFDGGIYYMWFMDSAGSYHLSDVQLATSTDGINFIRRGKLTPPATWWTTHGATAEPAVNHVRVAKVGGEWVLTAWVPNGTGFGDYNYNTMVLSIGTDPAHLGITQYGPLPTPPAGPAGNHAGPSALSTAIFMRGRIHRQEDWGAMS